MTVVYDHRVSARNRRERRAQRCRYRVEVWYVDGYKREGVHHFKWIAVAHSRYYGWADYDSRVIDTQADSDD